jgi:serine/threonine-protein kinase
VPFPFKGWVQKLLGHLGREPTPLHEVRSDVGPEVSAVVRRLMAKRPEDRYSSEEALAEELERLAPSLPGERAFRGTSLGRAEEDTIEG